MKDNGKQVREALSRWSLAINSLRCLKTRTFLRMKFGIIWFLSKYAFSYGLPPWAKFLFLDVLRWKGLHLPNICLLCYKDGESVFHVLLHCPFTSEVWIALLTDFGMTWVPSPDVVSVLSSCQTNAFNLKGKEICQMVPTTVCWSVWLERNNRVFDNYAEPSFQVYRKAKNFLLLWARRVPECNNDYRGGLLREWDSALWDASSHVVF